MPESTRIGIISDTHGYLTPKVHQLFKGVDRIIHAGDIGDAFIIPELKSIAPVTAIYGNTDGWSFQKRLSDFESLIIYNFWIEVFHIPLFSPQNNGHADNLIKVFGHTHEPRILWQNGVLHINPGSATNPRVVTKPSVAILELSEIKEPEAKILFFKK